jgi:phosphatidylserine/phosphatidylglycerophosphate/cardiolipin synthase-like enzyme
VVDGLVPGGHGGKHGVRATVPVGSPLGLPCAPKRLERLGPGSIPKDLGRRNALRSALMGLRRQSERLARSAAMIVALVLGACAAPTTGAPAPTLAASAPPAASAAVAHAAAPALELPALELIESVPVETSFGDPALADAATVWLDMIEHASRSLDIAQFYLSNEPGSSLEPIVAAIEAAARRGVAVRLLVEQKLLPRYPETVERLGRCPGIAVRRFDLSATMGGILHAKYFVIDGREAYLGSQNFDWRSLAHIHELGVRIRQADLVRALGELFALDWHLAAGSIVDDGAVVELTHRSPWHPVRVSHGAETSVARLAASPDRFLPGDATWDLPQLVARIDGARRSVHVQLLTYEPKMRDGSPFPDLDDALRRAAARGASVQLLLADWCKRPGTIEAVQQLARVAGVQVKLVTIPRASSGFIPFARVIHAKYLVVDGASAWIGTSNWGGDYFLKSRNVGLFVDGAGFGRQLEAVFQRGWTSPYAELLDPDAPVTPPNVEHE